MEPDYRWFVSPEPESQPQQKQMPRIENGKPTATVPESAYSIILFDIRLSRNEALTRPNGSTKVS